MQAPLLRLSGAGEVPMPPRQVDYAVEAKLVASLEGQGGKDALAGLPIPIRVTGNWADPQIAADWDSVFKSLAADPERLANLPTDLAEKAKDLGVALPDVGGEAGEILKGVTGGDKGDAAPGTDLLKKAPADALKGLLKRD
jgi:AsmA protein